MQGPLDDTEESSCYLGTNRDTFLAPIHRLPPELLSDIFILCVPSWRTHSLDSLQAPLLLTQICRQWRLTALSTQRLWSLITIAYSKSLNESLLESWLSRTRSSSLFLRLDAEDCGDVLAKRMWPAIAMMIRYCDRWKRVELALPPPIMYRFSSVRFRLAQLESLSIQDQHSRHTLRPLFNCFDHAPLLHNLRFESALSYSALQLNIPWHQLTTFDAPFHTIVECLETLQLMPNLVICRVVCDRIYDVILRPPTTLPNVKLPNLISMRISIAGPSAHLADIFGHLDLCALNDLHIAIRISILKSRTEDSWISHQSFLSFLARCSDTLRALTIEDVGLGCASPNIVPCCKGPSHFSHSPI